MQQLQIWDTAGQERFRSITQSYYRSANALILTYDITCEESFRCLPEWLREIEQYASNKVITVLVGNKIDLAEKREVSKQRAEEFSEAQNMYYLETSAKESDNVEKLFLDLACRLIKSNGKQSFSCPSLDYVCRRHSIASMDPAQMYAVVSVTNTSRIVLWYLQSLARSSRTEECDAMQIAV
ncbi:Ras-related protein Rab-30 [Chelonia mydas]|uniref:Ras-related protein Rab-30 n=1 Tax=Chelonia mydas TaxID=8469 RepID=M7C3I8_CHEMY|nr:Ras-related protein Rab-30 [Chelonia mydas]